MEVWGTCFLRKLVPGDCLFEHLVIKYKMFNSIAHIVQRSGSSHDHYCTKYPGNGGYPAPQLDSFSQQNTVATIKIQVQVKS